MALHIVIAEPSDVVRRGIRSILEGSADLLHATFAELSDAVELRAALSLGYPDIIIANPSFSALLPSGVRCVMLQTSLADGDKAPLFDEVISIYDPATVIREKLLRFAGGSASVRRHGPLSRREKEIVVCLVKGMTNRRIAEVLHLSPHTVGTHRRNISAKLDIHSISGLMVYAISNKLVRLDELGAGN